MSISQDQAGLPTTKRPNVTEDVYWQDQFGGHSSTPSVNLDVSYQCNCR
jgi:hypothetical protein